MRKVLVVAQSLDGYIAQSREQISTAWTSKEDRQWFGQISRQLGVLIMGAVTYQTIGRPLPERKIVVLNQPGELVELPELSAWQESEKTAVYRTDGRDIVSVLAQLEDLGVAAVAICGGARVYHGFLTQKLVDEMYVTIEPVLLGGGIKLTEGATWLEVWRWRVAEKRDLSSQTSVWHLVSA